MNTFSLDNLIDILEAAHYKVQTTVAIEDKEILIKATNVLFDSNRREERKRRRAQFQKKPQTFDGAPESHS